MAEKNEKPTQKKEKDARKEGQVGVSRDLAKAVTLGVMGELAFALESLWREKVELLLSLPTQRFGQPFVPVLMEMSIAAATLLLGSFTILGATGVVVAVLAYWGQFGVLISTQVLTPKLDRLNPVQGLMNLLSKKKLLELLAAALKASVLGVVMYLFIKSQLASIVSLSNGSPKDSYFGFVTLLHAAFRIAVGVSIGFSVADFALQKYMLTKSLYMSMEEVKQEYRESEGDPHLKGQRKQLAREWANSAPVVKTAKADAVVVNPTHFAVAMRYDANEQPLPIVLAKGRDEVAFAMIERAMELGIPVIRHVWLARTLYATGRADRTVPQSSFEAVAHVYAVIQEMGGSCSGRMIELETDGYSPSI